MNRTLFSSLHHARVTLATWRQNHKTERPHTRLAGQSPTEFAKPLSLERDHCRGCTPILATPPACAMADASATALTGAGRGTGASIAKLAGLDAVLPMRDDAGGVQSEAVGRRFSSKTAATAPVGGDETRGSHTD